MLVVYRGPKCANEAYISDAELEKRKLGPCGYGDHDDAYYQWGLDADPYKDAGAIMTENGDSSQVFDYKDNWHAPSEGLQAVNEGMKEEWKAKQQEWEPRAVPACCCEFRRARKRGALGRSALRRASEPFGSRSWNGARRG